MRPLNCCIYLDVFLKVLVAVINSVYSIHVPKGFVNYNMAQLEMLNVIKKIWGSG